MQEVVLHASHDCNNHGRSSVLFQRYKLSIILGNPSDRSRKGSRRSLKFPFLYYLLFYGDTVSERKSILKPQRDGISNISSMEIPFVLQNIYRIQNVNNLFKNH